MTEKTLKLRYLADAAQLLKTNQSIDKSTQGLGQGVSKLGGTLTKTLTPAAAGIGLAFRGAFNEVDGGLDAIRAGTGKTGSALESLEATAKSVGGKVTQPFSEVGAVLAEVAQRTGQTGKPLGTLTKQILDLARVTGGDAKASVAGITRLFGDWSVKTENQTGTLDKLFRVSQASGISVQTLSEQMVQFGSPLRTLGLDFETSAAMFAKWEKEGVNVQTALPGLRMALKKFAKDGKAPGPALQDTIEKIKNMKEAAGNTEAFKVFGTRAGPDLAAAIREGRFDFEEYLDVMENGDDTISKVAKETSSLGDKFQMLKNKAQIVIGPVGEVGMAAAGVAAGIGPALSMSGKFGEGLGKLGSKMGSAAKGVGSGAVSLIGHVAKVGPAIGTGVQAIGSGIMSVGRTVATGFGSLVSILAANPMILIIAGIAVAIAAVVILIIKHWDKVKAGTLAAWNAIKTGLTATWNAIKTAASAVFNFLKTIFLNFTPLGQIIQHWEKIKGFLSTAWNAIKSVATGVFNGLKTIFLNFTPIGQIIKNWEKIKSALAGVWEGIKKGFSGAWDFIVRTFKGALNFLIDAWNRLDFGINIKVPSWVPLVGGKGFSVKDIFPDIPRLAKGGIADSPTLALIGEGHEPEVVSPLSKILGPLESAERFLNSQRTAAPSIGRNELRQLIKEFKGLRQDMRQRPTTKEKVILRIGNHEFEAWLERRGKYKERASA